MLEYDWVLEFDIKGLFDNIDHSLLMRAVRKQVTCPWAPLYIERWLMAPCYEKTEHGLSGRAVLRRRRRQPSLANLFLHYTFDLWMARAFPHLRWCRLRMTGWCTAGPRRRRGPYGPR